MSRGPHSPFPSRSRRTSSRSGAGPFPLSSQQRVREKVVFFYPLPPSSFRRSNRAGTNPPPPSSGEARFREPLNLLSSFPTSCRREFALFFLFPRSEKATRRRRIPLAPLFSLTLVLLLTMLYLSFLLLRVFFLPFPRKRRQAARRRSSFFSLNQT